VLLEWLQLQWQHTGWPDAAQLVLYDSSVTCATPTSCCMAARFYSASRCGSHDGAATVSQLCCIAVLAAVATCCLPALVGHQKIEQSLSSLQLQTLWQRLAETSLNQPSAAAGAGQAAGSVPVVVPDGVRSRAPLLPLLCPSQPGTLGLPLGLLAVQVAAVEVGSC